MGLMEWAGVILGLALLAAVFQAWSRSSSKKQMRQSIEALAEFTPSQQLMANDGNTGIALDESSQKLCVIRQGTLEPELALLEYRDLLSVEMFEDGLTVTRTARGSQIGGALLGGLALGGVGAIVGGLSGKKVASDKIQRIDLRLLVNCTERPVLDINLMDVEAKKGGGVYNAAMEQARHWHGLLEVLIQRADRDDERQAPEAVQPEPQPVSAISVADELQKLAELHRQGVLTDTEFVAQKMKLLD
ncbi:Short C-terminal domain-containing protein [Ferrimonas sediminum]|uniref:Short C-terminal domain-containing protein n=1 Tax=Ferrimonas sediminum TaxID=718193 RepID=A0A1G8TR83_9GAMM|nr:SHOCT domain-containing protein [Ferrimonas sediminum]SDJ43923.1 Short C-terminal domain-containing protein [Ferrimonas sediminum]